jgi:predicted lipoprotein with Yx(FWY)xxD motif
MKAQSLFFRRPILLTSLVVLAALILSACQAGEIPATGATEVPEMEQATATMAPEATATTAPQPTPTEDMAASAAEAEISVYTDPEFGEILVGNDGMTLYIFTVDEPNTVNCADSCLVQWPPLLTEGNPVLGEGVDPSLVGTAPMADGTMIVTYDERPLYYWIADTMPGDTTGQGVGDVWYVISPQGDVLGMDSASQVMDLPSGEAAEDDAELNVVNDPALGEILVGKDGMTLYMFTRDEPNTVNCTGDCLNNWPPLVTQGNPVLGAGVDETLVDTAELPDGRMIVTYNGMPLYYFANDSMAGHTNGQGVGTVWFVVSPEGEVIGQ